MLMCLDETVCHEGIPYQAASRSRNPAPATAASQMQLLLWCVRATQGRGVASHFGVMPAFVVGSKWDSLLGGHSPTRSWSRSSRHCCAPKERWLQILEMGHWSTDTIEKATHRPGGQLVAQLAPLRRAEGAVAAAGDGHRARQLVNARIQQLLPDRAHDPHLHLHLPDVQRHLRSAK